MNITQIEANLQKTLSVFDKDTFIYDVLLAYGQPKASITRLQQGSLNLSKIAGEIEWKKKLFFKSVFKEDDIHALFNTLKIYPKALKNDPRFIVVTDFETLLAFDTKTNDSLNIPILDLVKHYDFFLPWAGMEKAQVQLENPADVKAAEKMGKLYGEIKKDNPTDTPEEVHNLNIFLSRLLFCFFAEDTGIFDKSLFTNAISSHTQPDGSDLNAYLDTLFTIMNTPPQYRTGLAVYLEAFPYVNGGLFRNNHAAPVFSKRSRQTIIECGELDWSAINPDIFGSMIQAVVSAEDRGSLGMHYTSVPNIMKVIEPLFLNDLKEEFEASKGNLKKLNALLQRLWNIKIFDPACGSGNFLIIAYKELRKLEMLIFKEIDAVNQMYSNQFSGISLGNFYGIELDDFAHEVAILSLWLAEHQMNQAFFNEFKRRKPALPLMETGNIVQGNATRLDWAEICPYTEGGEVFILGNPPYLGSSMQSAEQKEDMAYVFKGIEGYKNLDYIACWFLKGAKYIQNQNAQFAFVSTNSICQGEQVAMLWPHIFNKNLEIGFAYTSFKWVNNAKYNAGVTVVIVGIRCINKTLKYIFTAERKVLTNNINAYLASGQNIMIEKRSKMLSALPEMTYGNKAVYGEPLILSTEEKEKLTNEYKGISIFFKKFIGAKELIDGSERWVIWIRDEDLKNALSFKPLFERIENVKNLRLSSKDIGANELALRAHQFRDTFETTTQSVVVPLTTSEKRNYIPLGFFFNETILSNATSVVYDADAWVFTVISSKMHMIWVRAVCGSLETRIRYSSVLGYNTFPVPPLSIAQKEELKQHTYRILREREEYSGKTLAQLYDPDKMPEGLREAHRQNDLAVERIYRSRPFESDEERLEYLFKLYERMIAEEKERGTLFEAEKKIKVKKK